jgi:hypothetical protein
MKDNPIVNRIEKYIATYATLAADYYLLPLVLWTIGTHAWIEFDAFPYLVITAYTKRAGKTRLMELLSFLSANGRTYSAGSPASMFRDIAEVHPAMFIDEAEQLNQENHPARELLNKGYRKGQTITRVIGNEVVEFDTYCPKCFVLIGDVYDTLKDRAMQVVMRRRTPVEAANSAQFRLATAKGEGVGIRIIISEEVEEKQAEIKAEYMGGVKLEFLNDRDEEIWQSLFALAKVFCPSRIEELTRSAVDMSTEKTAVKRTYRDLLQTEEKKADDAEAAVLLLRDMVALTDGKEHITSSKLVETLQAIPTAPWRKFRGKGLTMNDVSNLLDTMNVHPKVIRLKSRGKAATSKGATARGYRRSDLLAAAQLVGLLD